MMDLHGHFFRATVFEVEIEGHVAKVPSDDSIPCYSCSVSDHSGGPRVRQSDNKHISFSKLVNKFHKKIKNIFANIVGTLAHALLHRSGRRLISVRFPMIFLTFANMSQIICEEK